MTNSSKQLRSFVTQRYRDKQLDTYYRQIQQECGAIELLLIRSVTSRWQADARTKKRRGAPQPDLTVWVKLEQDSDEKLELALGMLHEHHATVTKDGSRNYVVHLAMAQPSAVPLVSSLVREAVREFYERHTDE